jgi:hypothetical protein
LDARRANGDGYQEGYLVEVAEESINAWRPVVLHAAVGLLEQAKPQILYTQIVNYNPPQSTTIQHIRIYNTWVSFLVWFVKLRGIVLNFGAWEWCWARGRCGGWAILR